MSEGKVSAVVLVRPHDSAWPALETKVMNALDDLDIALGEAFEIRRCTYSKTKVIAEQTYNEIRAVTAAHDAENADE